MSKPAIQNIPLRTETGRKLRKVFIESQAWVECDFASIEIRIVAEMLKVK